MTNAWKFHVVTQWVNPKGYKAKSVINTISSIPIHVNVKMSFLNAGM
jgi:biotin synthase-like enzyme